MLLTLRKNLTKQRGIGLLELMLSIAIISILLIMATRYYASTQQAQKVTSTIAVMNAIVSANASYANDTGGAYTTDITKLVPAYLTIANSPWDNSSLTLGAASKPNGKYSMTIGGITANGCTVLNNMLGGTTGSTSAIPGLIVDSCTAPTLVVDYTG